VLDPTSVSRDRLQETSRWGGYAGDLPEDQLPIEEQGGASRWLPWLVLLVIAVLVVAVLVGLPT
jgi:hypothetical protein